MNLGLVCAPHMRGRKYGTDYAVRVWVSVVTIRLISTVGGVLVKK